MTTKFLDNEFVGSHSGTLALKVKKIGRLSKTHRWIY